MLTPLHRTVAKYELAIIGVEVTPSTIAEQVHLKALGRTRPVKVNLEIHDFEKCRVIFQMAWKLLAPKSRNPRRIPCRSIITPYGPPASAPQESVPPPVPEVQSSSPSQRVNTPRRDILPTSRVHREACFSAWKKEGNIWADDAHHLRGDVEYRHNVPHMAEGEASTIKDVLKDVKKAENSIKVATLATPADFSTLNSSYLTALNAEYNFPTFVTFDEKVESLLTSSTPHLRDRGHQKLRSFAHRLFDVVKSYSTPYELANIHEFCDTPANRRDHSPLRLMMELNGLLNDDVLKGTEFNFARGGKCKTFNSFFCGFKINGKQFGVWRDLSPWRYIYPPLFGNLLLYMHLLNEAFNRTGTKMTMYSRLAKPIYTWLDKTTPDDKFTGDERYKLTAFLMRMETDEQRSHNDTKRDQQRHRASNKQRLNIDDWLAGIALLQQNLAQWDTDHPKWPKLDVREQLSDSSGERVHFRDMVIAVIVATGCRPSEVYAISDFHPVFKDSDSPERWIINITKVAKQRFRNLSQAREGGRGRMAPLLYFDSRTVASMVDKIRWYVRTQLGEDELTLEKAHTHGRSIDYLHTEINRRVRAYFGDGISQKELRALWANLTYDDLRPDEERLLWIQRGLGHQDIATAVSYATWWVTGSNTQQGPGEHDTVSMSDRLEKISLQLSPKRTKIAKTPQESSVGDLIVRRPYACRPGQCELLSEMDEIDGILTSIGKKATRYAWRQLGFGNKTISAWNNKNNKN